jgi:hypothetical protein
MIENDKIIEFSDIVKECDNELKLEDQLTSKIQNKDSRLNRCSYQKEGYMYQQVFSCRTCYEDMIKEKLEADKESEFSKMTDDDKDLFLEKVTN